MSIHVFGIRHHGPGCARSLRAALDELRPDVVAIEGPADAADVVTLAADPTMKPPVAMLLYPKDEPMRAVYYPLCEFSPEWQAIRWATDNGVPVRLIDLPQANHLALDIAAEKELEARIEAEAAEQSEEEAEAKHKAENTEDDTSFDMSDDEAVLKKQDRRLDLPGDEDVDDTDPAEIKADESAWRADPMAILAEAAGYKDHELWWEEQIERRSEATDLFLGIAEAMQPVREEIAEYRPRDLMREAHMRRELRKIVKEGAERTAVVCGAWHAPVLDEQAVAGKRPGCSRKEDTARLKGLPKVRTTATWIPWTFSRLTFRSGYGAGVHSPGWYEHIWQGKDDAPMRWIATAARLLRTADLDASSASVIEAFRLAEALAAMRRLRSPGLAELTEAILTVLCHGEPSPMRLIRSQLEIGDRLGEVPESTPSVPLARDIAQLQKSLRMKPSSEYKLVDLDLRKENGIKRSHLLHRLCLLGIPWGKLQSSGSSTSTFHEIWEVCWEPEFNVAIIEANVWGTTVESAATAKIISAGRDADELSAITKLLDQAILSDLNDAVDPLLEMIQTQAAIASDVRHLLDSMLPLARVVRYGDVRRTRSDHVLPVLVNIFERAVVGLPAACSGLDEEAAERMLDSIDGAQESLNLLALDELLDTWHARLRDMIDSDLHGMLRGRACRILLEKGLVDDEELDRHARLALSVANDPMLSAAWLTGLMRGSGLVLLHQDGFWTVMDRWLDGLAEETFVELLPVLRRAMSDFTPAERRQMGEKVKSLGGSDRATPQGKSAGGSEDPNFNADRAAKVMPILAHILGVEYDDAK